MKYCKNMTYMLLEVYLIVLTVVLRSIYLLFIEVNISIMEHLFQVLDI